MTTKRGDIKLMIERMISARTEIGMLPVIDDAVELFEKLDAELAFERQEHHTFKLGHANLAERIQEYKAELAAIKQSDPVGYKHPILPKAMSIEDFNEQPEWVQRNWSLGQKLYTTPQPDRTKELDLMLDKEQHRVELLESALREARDALVKNIIGTSGRTQASHEAIATINKVLP